MEIVFKAIGGMGSVGGETDDVARGLAPSTESQEPSPIFHKFNFSEVRRVVFFKWQYVSGMVLVKFPQMHSIGSLATSNVVSDNVERRRLSSGVCCTLFTDGTRFASERWTLEDRRRGAANELCMRRASWLPAGTTIATGQGEVYRFSRNRASRRKSMGRIKIR